MNMIGNTALLIETLLFHCYVVMNMIGNTALLIETLLFLSLLCHDEHDWQCCPVDRNIALPFTIMS